MKKVLITGFEPFGEDRINPALEAVKQLDGVALEGGVIVTCQVPVVRYRSIEAVKRAIEAHQPEAVITVGQAGGRAGITPERVAINLDDFRIPDNDGIQVIDEPIVENGPAAYFATLPIKSMVRAMQEYGLPASVSNTAGTFVCNHLFYGIAHYLASSSVRHGFVHIPYLPEQVVQGVQPSMSLEHIVKGLVIAAQAVIDHEVDCALSQGTIC